MTRGEVVVRGGSLLSPDIPRFSLTPVSLPAAELEAGARLRDRGRLRRVRSVEPAVTSDSLRVFFDDDPQRVDWLRVNIGQMVTVWRGESGG